MMRDKPFQDVPYEMLSIRFAPFSASGDTVARATQAVLAIQFDLGRALAQAMWSAQADFLHAAGRAVLDAQVRMLDTVLQPGTPGWSPRPRTR